MEKLKLGILGCGGIAHEVVEFIVEQLSDKIKIVALSDVDAYRANDLKEKCVDDDVLILSDIEDLVETSDMVLETAVGEVVRPLLESCLKHKKDVILLSIGGILSCDDLIDKIQANGIDVYHPSGAISGVDAVYAASYSKINKLCLTTSKPPAGLGGQETVSEAKVLFEGTAKEAYKLFPRNINVAATLYIASRYEDLKVIIKVDPAIKRNVHRIELQSDIVNMVTEVENLPLASNPKTSAMAAASTKALLGKMFSPIKVGV